MSNDYLGFYNCNPGWGGDWWGNSAMVDNCLNGQMNCWVTMRNGALCWFLRARQTTTCGQRKTVKYNSRSCGKMCNNSWFPSLNKCGVVTQIAGHNLGPHQPNGSDSTQLKELSCAPTLKKYILYLLTCTLPHSAEYKLQWLRRKRGYIFCCRIHSRKRRLMCHFFLCVSRN